MGHLVQVNFRLSCVKVDKNLGRVIFKLLLIDLIKYLANTSNLKEYLGRSIFGQVSTGLAQN